MSSVSDTVTDPTTPNENKNQTLTEEPVIANNESDSNLKPLDQDGVSEKKDAEYYRKRRESILMENNYVGGVRRSARLRKIQSGDVSRSDGTSQDALPKLMEGESRGKYMESNDDSKPQELSEHPQIETFRCKTCNVTCFSKSGYNTHLQGRKHLKNVRRRQVLLGAGQQAVSGGRLGLQALYPPENNALSNATNAQVQQHDNNPLDLSEPVQIEPFRCDLCDVKCPSQVVLKSHMSGKKHYLNLRRSLEIEASFGVGQQQASSGAPFGLPSLNQQALSGAPLGLPSLNQQAPSGTPLGLPSLNQQAPSGTPLGIPSLNPPDIHALSNAINAQVQRGDNDPQVLLAQLLMTLICQAQIPATAPVTGAMATQLPAPTFVAGPSYDPQLLQTNPYGETKSELLPGSSFSTQIEGGKGGKYMRTSDGSKPVKPAQALPFRRKSQVDYRSHVTGKRHLINQHRARQEARREAWLSARHPHGAWQKARHAHCARQQDRRAHCAHQAQRAHDMQASSGVGQQQAQCENNALSNATYAQVQQGDNNQQVLSKPAKIQHKKKKPAKNGPYHCKSCNWECNKQSDYLRHLNGRYHHRQRRIGRLHRQPVVSGEFLGFRSQPDINALSNAVNAKVKQGFSNKNPQVRLGQLMMTVLSKTPAKATAPVTGAMVAEIPTSTTSLTGSTPVVAATSIRNHNTVEMENPSGET